MSLVRTVARLIEERGGEGTADDLLPLLPDNSRKAIRKALENARDTGLLETVQTGKLAERSSGPSPARYRRTKKSLVPKKTGGNHRSVTVLGEEAPDDEDDDEDDTKPLSHKGLPPRGKIPKVASVWELASVL